jgi:hypothetical protein
MVDSTAEASFGPPVLVDAHVHLHRCFHPGAFLGAAEANFRKVESILGLGSRAVGLLVLTKHADEWSLRDLMSSGTGGGDSAWTYERTDEELSLLALSRGQVRIILVAGRQVRTAEALEVLALGCDAELPEGRPIGETLTAIRAAGSVAVVPWGFGKWWFHRGRILDCLLETEEGADFFLGDSGRRPDAFRRPALFHKAERLGIRDLPGSDPFPFAGETSRIGSRGFVVPQILGRKKPAATLLSLLRDPGFRPESYGVGERFSPFLHHQLGMQLRKWSLGPRLRPPPPRS